MEDLQQIAVCENDDSFSLLYSSFDLASAKDMDELSQAKLYIAKLSEIREKYETNCNTIADDFDAMEVKHADEMKTKDVEYQDTLKKLQDTVLVCTTELKAKQAEIDDVHSGNDMYKTFLVGIRNRKSLYNFKSFCSIFLASTFLLDLVQ